MDKTAYLSETTELCCPITCFLMQLITPEYNTHTMSHDDVIHLQASNPPMEVDI